MVIVNAVKENLLTFEHTAALIEFDMKAWVYQSIQDDNGDVNKALTDAAAR